MIAYVLMSKNLTQPTHILWRESCLPINIFVDIPAASLRAVMQKNHTYKLRNNVMP